MISDGSENGVKIFLRCKVIILVYLFIMKSKVEIHILLKRNHIFNNSY